MSTPPMPPYPPQDPKAQWKAYREQQKATFRAQRDAWKAQRHAWQGTYAPRVPSLIGPVLLIGIGVVALLLLSDKIPANQFWSWYAHWWPLVLIGGGLALLAEWALDTRRATPVRRGHGYIGLLILLACLGLAAAGWHRNIGSGTFGFNGTENWFNMDHSERDNEATTLTQQVAGGAIINIQNPRGDISISSSDDQTVTVQPHQVAYADSDEAAKKIFDAEPTTINTNGRTVDVRASGNSKGRVNLTVTVPKNAYVTVSSSQGDLAASGLGAGLAIYTVNGDTNLNTIAGPVTVHFGGSRHDFSAHQLTGDLTITGDGNDLSLSQIAGRTSINGEIFGDVRIEGLGGPLNLHTSITNLQVAALPGNLSLDSNDLQLAGAKGAVHIITGSKDVDLSQIAGDSYVENHNGSVTLTPSGNYNVEVKNNKGDIELTLPDNASASISGFTHNGDIVSEFPLATTGDENKNLSGRIGAGHARVTLNTSNGDLRIKRGGAQTTEIVAAPAAPAAPANPHARHLKVPRNQETAKPVTQ